MYIATRTSSLPLLRTNAISAQPLHSICCAWQDRQALLQRIIAEAPPGGVVVGGGTVSARLAALLPGAVLLDDTAFSRVGTTVEAIQDMFDRALEKQVGCWAVEQGFRGHGAGGVCYRMLVKLLA
jgi:hypothetical protein